MSSHFQILTIAVLFMISSSHCQNPCSFKESEFMPSAIVREDGNAWDPETRTLYPNGTYWFLPNSTTLMGCPCKLGRPCLRKCCQIGQVMTSSLDCIPRNTSYDDGGAWFNPELADNNGSTVISVNGTRTKLGLLTEKPCSSKRGSSLMKEEFFIRSGDAQLCHILSEKVVCIERDRFCLDYFEDEGAYLPVKCPWQRAGWTVKFVHTALEDMIINLFKIMTQTISSLALCIVLALYTYCPSLRTVHGKCHMCHAVCLLLYYSLQTLIVHSRYLLRVDGICYLLGPSEFYLHLAPLSWLNVMSSDILMAFLNLRPVSYLKNGESRKFIIFSCYGWGVPLLAFLITVTVDFCQPVENRPIGKEWCVEGRFRNWFYKTAVMYTLMIINAIIFSWTAIKIYMLKRETAVFHNQDSRRHSKDIDNSNNKTKMYLKLLLLMGFHWILEPVTKALHNTLRLDSRLGIRMIWYVIALVNRLQGLFIFLMFIGNEKLSGVAWMKFSKSMFWKKLLNQPSLKKSGISTISLNTLSGIRGARKSVDSTDTTENELSDTSRSDPMEGCSTMPAVPSQSQSTNADTRRMSMQHPVLFTKQAQSTNLGSFTNEQAKATSSMQKDTKSLPLKKGSSEAKLPTVVESSDNEIADGNAETMPSVSTINEGKPSSLSSDGDLNSVEMTKNYKALTSPESNFDVVDISEASYNPSPKKTSAARKKSVSFENQAASLSHNTRDVSLDEEHMKESTTGKAFNETISDSAVIAIGIEESSNPSDLLATSIV